MQNRKRISVGKVAAYLLLLLAVAGAIGFSAVYTNGFTDNFSSFYVETDGVKILSKQEKTVEPGAEIRFDVRYVFGNGSKEEKGYFVGVVPAEGADFDYSVDGQVYSFAAETDLTAGFDIVRESDRFSLKVPEVFSLEQTLSKVHGGKAVEIGTMPAFDRPYFELVVSSYNDKAQIRIPLRFRIGVEAIVLNKEHLILW